MGNRNTVVRRTFADSDVDWIFLAAACSTRKNTRTIGAALPRGNPAKHIKGSLSIRISGCEHRLRYFLGFGEWGRRGCYWLGYGGGAIRRRRGGRGGCGIGRRRLWLYCFGPGRESKNAFAALYCMVYGCLMTRTHEGSEVKLEGFIRPKEGIGRVLSHVRCFFRHVKIGRAHV